MKTNKLLIFLLILLLLVGCSRNNIDGNEDQEDSAPQELEFNFSDQASLIMQQTDISPSGVTIIDRTVVISDASANCLKLYDFVGKPIGSVGQLGNKEGDFVRPRGLDYLNGYLFVVDEGNHRVQVFDSDYQYQDSYMLDELEYGGPDTYYTDIAATGSNRFIILTNSVIQEDARIYEYTENGFIKTKHALNGFTTSDNDCVYVVNTFELNETDTAYEGNIRSSSFYKLEDGVLKELFTFPYKYAPVDFVVDGSDVYVLTCGWAELDHFKLDGTYVETLWEFDILSPESYIAYSPKDGFVVADSQYGTVYFIAYSSN